MGRKGRYETHVQPFLSQIEEWYQDLDERQIADRLGVAVSSFEKYKSEHKELRDVLIKGKQQLVAELKASLKKKAKGFEYEEIKTVIRRTGSGNVTTIEKYRKYAQPDTGAIHLLLKNLDPDWHNDDQATIDLKKEQMEIAREKAEKDAW